MKTKILSLLLLLGVSFTAVNASPPCSEIRVIPVQSTLQSCDGSQGQTVEVIIHSPDYCYADVTDISLSDSANFELNTSYGEVPCDSEDFIIRGYQFCTVGVTFKPTTTSGTFETEISVSTVDTPVTSASINGEIVNSTTTCTCGNHGHHGSKCGHKAKKCDNGNRCGSKCSTSHHGSKCGHKAKRCDNGNKCGSKCSTSHHGSKCGHKAKRCDNNQGNGCTTCSIKPVKTLADIKEGKNYLACLNLTNPVGSSAITIVGNDIIFDNFNEQDLGLATFQLNSVVNSVSMLTFDANISNGLMVIGLNSTDGNYYQTRYITKSNKYGFIFPSNLSLTTLQITTWENSFSGTLEDISLNEVKNSNITSNY